MPVVLYQLKLNVVEASLFLISLAISLQISDAFGKLIVKKIFVVIITDANFLDFAVHHPIFVSEFVVSDFLD